MEILSAHFELDALFARLSASCRSLLILDYDGTLAPFTENPEEALPYPGVKERIAALQQIPGAEVVVMSGRAVEAVKRLLGVEPPPELWGSHGGERLKKGEIKVQRFSLEKPIREVLLQAAEEARKCAPQLHVEVKPLSIALHWRERSLDGKEDVVRLWEERCEDSPLELHFFDGGVEIRPKGVNKGEAVKRLLQEAPLDSVIAYLGDDFTDEEAFSALGERALKVLVRSKKRKTLADLWILPPKELLEFLDRWIKALGWTK